VTSYVDSAWRRVDYSAASGSAAASFGASALSVVTRTASIFNPLFISNRCFRSKLFTNSRVAFPIAPPILDASILMVRPSGPVFRSSYFRVTL
jgi:hypothetical protein